MKKHHDRDQDLSGIAFASFDHRSATFRQKRHEHFQACNQQPWMTMSGIPAPRREGAVIHFKEPV